MFTSQGIAQFLEYHVRPLLADGQLVQVLPEWVDDVYPPYAYQHPVQLISAKVPAFLDSIVELTRDTA